MATSRSDPVDAAEAIAACEFWTENVAETRTLGLTSDPEVGKALNGMKLTHDRTTGAHSWAIEVPHIVGGKENPLYSLVLAELARRAGGGRHDVAA